MLELALGLLIFLGVHSVRIFADGWRTRTRDRMGALPWKGVYSLLSIVGFVLIVHGFGQTRLAPVVLWVPPLPMRHIAALLTLITFIFLVAAYVPGNAIKAKLRHPMILGVKVWALAHLLANGQLAHVVLFGSFLLWAILNFRASRQRDRLAPPAPLRSSALATMLTVAVGVAAWVGFAFWGHLHLIGKSPLGV
ncbi:MAG: protein NrnU [Aquabacterium sp.]|uniref:NnrU family protein n=1 Tax=Aquabacterium sp. TaxID=1872578 RepID=UPI001219F320|nr:NnrU family protein [Aquabacterium sp.]TAK93183.1 MAG: protein NrnU [Aquabacterium sp.]